MFARFPRQELTCKVTQIQYYCQANRDSDEREPSTEFAQSLYCSLGFQAFIRKSSPLVVYSTSACKPSLIDARKIDPSFIRQITIAPDETSIVTVVINMGRSLKLRVVAEGVETQEELAFLQAHQ
jgi:EAL domain